MIKNKFSQQQKFQQKLALNAQVKQSIQLLRMATQELNEYIDSSLEKNPFLKKEFDKKKAQNIATSSDYKERTLTAAENPRLSLLSQAKMLNLDDTSLEIAEHLIYEMNDSGYIEADLEEVARDFYVNIDEVEKVLSLIQSMDPPGIGARDVRECLQLQLIRMGKENSLEYTIVTNFISELATEDAGKIAKALDIDKKKAQDAIRNIKKLNPRPASTLLSKEEKPVIPDLIANVKDDKIRLEMNREWFPRLRLYNPYENKLDIVKDPEVKEFMKENMNAARHLIDGLRRREETMCKVADYILKIQKDCLMRDISQIKSLTLSEVAEALNLHPSTISRTVSNKYIQINDKVVPLKTLLSHGIKKENGELTSKTSIKARIKELIASEDKSKPLSDNDIKERLEQEGVGIERRTVAKYRESLRLLPGYLRKKNL